MDGDEVCLLALEFLYLSQPEAFSSWLGHLAGSTARMSHITVEALAFGKESSNTAVEDTRIIMPLPSVLGLLDATLPYLIEPHIIRLLPCPQSVWFGAHTHTQVLDISHGLSTVIEKALDMKSEGAIAQSDVR